MISITLDCPQSPEAFLKIVTALRGPTIGSLIELYADESPLAEKLPSTRAVYMAPCRGEKRKKNFISADPKDDHAIFSTRFQTALCLNRTEALRPTEASSFLERLEAMADQQILFHRLGKNVDWKLLSKFAIVHLPNWGTEAAFFMFKSANLVRDFEAIALRLSKDADLMAEI